MTDERINRVLAEFMGWQWIDYLHIKDENGNWIFDGSPFDPRNDANHAELALIKLNPVDARIWRVDGTFHCTILMGERYKDRYNGFGKTMAIAITDAINKAVGGAE